MIYAEWSPRFMRCAHIGVERNVAMRDHGGGVVPRSGSTETSFTDCGIDATVNWIDQTRTRVDGRSAPSTLSLPTSQVSDIRGCACEGLSATPSQGGAEPRTLNQRGSLRGLAPSCTRRRVPPSRRRGATLSRGEPTVIHCRRAPFSVGKRGVRYPFVPKAGRCRRRWVSSTQSFESRSARVPR